MAVFAKSKEQRAEFIRQVADLEEQEVLQLVRARLEENENPLNIVEDCQEGAEAYLP